MNTGFKLTLVSVCIVLFAALLSGCRTQSDGHAEPASAQATQTAQAAPSPPSVQGYRCVAFDGEGFLASGTAGRLDRIGVDKQVINLAVPTEEDLLDVWIEDDLILVCGTGGTILYSADTQNFTAASTGISTTIYGVARFQGQYYACTDSGIILCSNDGLNWDKLETGVGHSIVSIAATDKRLMAITVESDILVSENGLDWQVENFNEVYLGYYEPFAFTNISAMGDLFCVTGSLLADDTVPHVMMSDTGEVWIFRPLDRIEGMESDEPLPLVINAIGYDLDQMLMACNDGQILTVSDCYKCNKVETFGNTDLRDLSLGGDKLIIVGDDYEFDVLDGSAARQYDIKPEQAYADLISGAAVIIDVRTDEEYADGHILGCVHIPVDQIRQQLSKEVLSLDTKLIFYCQGGGRAQTALEIALELGYQRVYNLGGFADWIYATESGQ